MTAEFLVGHFVGLKQHLSPLKPLCKCHCVHLVDVYNMHCMFVWGKRTKECWVEAKGVMKAEMCGE